jgi:hypothetical protein
MGAKVSMTDDEIIETMFDEVKTVSVQTVNGKRYISDEETLREMEFAEACEAMVSAEREWKKLEIACKADPKADVCAYFDALETRYQTDKKLWELFTAGDRSVCSNKMYNEYRLILLRGETTKADA